MCTARLQNATISRNLFHSLFIKIILFDYFHCIDANRGFMPNLHDVTRFSSSKNSQELEGINFISGDRSWWCATMLLIIFIAQIVCVFRLWSGLCALRKQNWLYYTSKLQEGEHFDFQADSHLMFGKYPDEKYIAEIPVQQSKKAFQWQMLGISK